MKRLIPMLCALLALLFLAACENPPNDAPAGATAAVKTPAQTQKPAQTKAAPLIEPEQLISKSDAEALLGIKVAEGKKTDNAAVGQKLCFYDAADDDSDKFLQIAITQQAFMPSGSPNTPESIYHSTKAAFDAVEVEGLGDEAVLITGGYYILCDGYLLQIFAGNTQEQATIDLLDAAGELAVSRLQELAGGQG